MLVYTIKELCRTCYTCVRECPAKAIRIVGGQAEAESVISKLKPSLAIFDLMMENDDSGFILCYKIKRKYPDVPVILATAVAHETGISFSLDSEAEKSWIRADRYLEKGIRAEQLDHEVMKLLKI